MKKIFFTILFLCVLCCPVYGITRNLGDTHLVQYTLIDVDGNPVSGDTVILQIQRVSDDYWWDFDDSTFKNSGWTDSDLQLSYETMGEYYYYKFVPTDTSADEYIFVVDNVSTTYGDHQAEVVSYQADVIMSYCPQMPTGWALDVVQGEDGKLPNDHYIPQITVSTLVVASANDEFCPAENAKQLYHDLRMQDKKLVIIPNATHRISVEREGHMLFMEALYDWFKD